MRLSRQILSLALWMLIANGLPASATAEYQYRPDEYVAVQQGEAPDRRHAIATHGESETGNDNFRVWLMESGRPIVALPGIDEHHNLDSAAVAYKAYWSPDSRHVAVGWRVNRHIVQLNLYAVEGRRATPVELPDLFKEVTGRALRHSDDVRTDVPIIEWTGRSRFVLKQYRLLVADKAAAPALLRSLGRFGQPDDAQPQPQRTFVVFVVDAACIVHRPSTVRLVDLQIGDLAAWRRPASN
jgi:hypothetical protein